MKITLLLVALASTAVALHSAGFSAPMYCDSAAYLQENESVFAGESVLNVIKIHPPRPVVMGSFYLDYLVAGMCPFYFRLINAVLLTLTSLALFFFIVLLFEIPALEVPADSARKQVVAFFCSLAFLVHPAQGQVVLYIWQRMALLACMFYLLTLVTYLAARLGIIKRRRLGFVASGILFLCAVFSKENAFTLPIVIILVEVILFRLSFRVAFKFAAIAVLVALLVLVPLAMTAGLPGTQETGLFHLIRLYYQISGLTPWQAALTQSRMLFDYLSLSLAPFLVSMAFWVAPVISRSLFNPPVTVVAAGGVITLVGLSLVLLRRRPLTSFGILFFVLNLIPEAAVIPTHIFFAYRAILPLVGIILVVADIGVAAWSWAESCGVSPKVKMGLGATLVIWIAASAAVTVSKAIIWREPYLVWEEAVRHLPPPDTDFEQMHGMAILDSLGSELQHKRRFEEAVKYHDRSLKIFPNTRTFALMATALAGSGDADNADKYFRRAFEARASDGRALVFAHAAYAEFLESAGRKREAAGQYGAALRLRPGVALWNKKLGRLHLASGDLSEAEKCFRNALELEPASPEAHYDLGTALKIEGKLDEAIRHYETALQLKPDHAWAYNNLGRILENKGDVVAALSCYAKAIKFDKNLAEAHLNMGNVLAGLNRLNEAIRHYRTAIAIRPDYPQAHNNIGVALEEKGDIALAAEHYKLALQLKPDTEIFAKNLTRVRYKLQQQSQAVTH